MLLAHGHSVTGSSRSYRSTGDTAETVKPVKPVPPDLAVAEDSFGRQRLGGRPPRLRLTGDSVKGIASLPRSMRPHGRTVRPITPV